MPEEQSSEGSPAALLFSLVALAFLSGLALGIFWCDSTCQYREVPLLEAFRAQIHSSLFPDQHRVAKKALDWGVQSFAALVSAAAAGTIPAALAR